MKKRETFCPGCQTRDKRAPPFVPAWRSRLGNRDNRGFPTGTNQRFCSSVSTKKVLSIGSRFIESIQCKIKMCSEKVSSHQKQRCALVVVLKARPNLVGFLKTLDA